MLYTLYELGHAAVAPLRGLNSLTRAALVSPYNLASQTFAARTMTAATEVFEGLTRRYNKPEWGLDDPVIGDDVVPVVPKSVWSDTWCDLVHFERDPAALKAARGGQAGDDPKVLIVAPMSGHFATLLRGTVQGFLADHDVYITDWTNARLVPVGEGRFGFDDYVEYVRRMITHLGPQTHVVAVCQPGPAVLSTVALMAEDDDPCRPATMTFMGSPIDARQSPTEPNRLAEERPLKWFKNNMVHTVPAPYGGMYRRVYPGFLQLISFVHMNWDRHVGAHWDFFEKLVAGDGDSAEAHRKFYDEYLAVMDLTEEFYIETIDRVFQRHLLPTGQLMVRNRLVNLEAIRDVGLFTVEGERDDISGIGQTQAALSLCSQLPDEKKQLYVQPEVGHYGVFNGRRFRTEIQPRIAAFMRKHAQSGGQSKVQTERVVKPKAKTAGARGTKASNTAKA